MKNIFYTIILSFNIFSAHAQLVNCRPKVCLIDYNYHDDRNSNYDMATIKSLRPDILIDNTPGGYWGQQNGGVGCLPAQYTPLGIQVFSYITGGYEGTKYNDNRDILNLNLARIDAIASDGATGVFLDEVSSFPDADHKAYLNAIYNRCQSKGLKLIFNPGVNNFDSWLMSYCDYLMSDEHYNGSRTPSFSEQAFASRILVVAQDITSASSATTITQGAHTNGFGFSYVCQAYTSLPTWINDYFNQITQFPPSPPSLSGNTNITAGQSTTLTATGCNGTVKWYNSATGSELLSSANAITVSPTSNQSYYAECKNSYCESETRSEITVNVISSCADNPVLPDYYEGQFAQIKAKNTIVAYNTIGSGADVLFQAGKSVTLTHGFRADSGSVFKVQIQECN